MAKTTNLSARASLHGLGLETDLPLGATVADPAQWDVILAHYRGAAQVMRDGAGEYLTADPYLAEWHQLEDEANPTDEQRDCRPSGAIIWSMPAIAIGAIALIAWCVA
jgi:hypothetical protein